MMNDNPWWCPHCRVGVDNRGILQDMRHVFCGNQVIPMETLPDRDKLIAALEARLAAMREAMERFKWYIENSDGFWMGDKCGAWALDDNQSLEYQVMELLNSDAGRALLERLRKAEASLEAYMKWETNIKQVNDVTDISLTDWAAFMTGKVKVLNNLLDQAMAERVEAVPTDGRSLCEMAACPHWNDGDCLVLSCGVKYMYDFLLTHQMIREAE